MANNKQPVVLDLSFTGSLPSGVSFARASSAWYFNSSSILTQASSDAARFDTNPATGASRGLLIEPQRQTLIAYSAFTSLWNAEQAGWGTNGTSPNGTANAKFMVPAANSIITTIIRRKRWYPARHTRRPYMLKPTAIIMPELVWEPAGWQTAYGHGLTSHPAPAHMFHPGQRNGRRDGLWHSKRRGRMVSNLDKRISNVGNDGISMLLRRL